MAEVAAHPSKCYPRVMFGDDTHESTETKYREMTESTLLLLQKDSRRGSKSSGSFQYEWHEAPGVVDVRAEKGPELVFLLPDAVFYGERLPGEARECGILVRRRR